jgi:purine-cytosine permease-like protein
MDSQKSLIGYPSAFLPLVMSIAALGLVLVHIVLFGTARQADEGVEAHLWQLLMAAQVLIVLYFAVRYLLLRPKQALMILALQITAGLAACAPVYLLHW